MTWNWYASNARIDVPPLNVHPGQSAYLRDADADAAPDGWLRRLTDAEVAALKPFWYRAITDWRDGQHRVVAGRTYTIDRILAEHILRDTDGAAIRPLTPTEIAETAAALSYATEATGSVVTPPAPDLVDPRLGRDGSTRGATTTGEAMHTANSGFIAG